MATTVTSSIGTGGRTFSAPQSWEDAIPSDLTAADEQHVGEMYNDSEFTGSGVQVDMSGHTCDATRNMILTVAAGHSFMDHADAETNPIAYDVSKGVGLRMTADDLWVVRPGGAYTEVRRIQVKAEGNNARGINAAVDEGTNRLCKDIISETLNASPIDIFRSGTLINVHGIVLGTSGNGGRLGLGSTAIGCTMTRPSDVTAAGTGWQTNYGTNILVSCGTFGFSTAADASGWDATASKNNGTDQATGLPGTSPQHSIPYSRFTPFVDAAGSTRDFRAIAGTPLAGNGFLNGTLAPNDIVGKTRAASPTIGAWEIAASGGSSGGFFRIPESMAFKPLTGVY